MKKIPTIFKRNPDDMSRLLNEPHPDCDWVFKGEGVATRKYDGTCCLVRDGKLYKRREVKKGKPEPDGFELAEHDQTTGKKVGWVAVTDSADDKWHWSAFQHLDFPDGTYELVGPKVQHNPENYDTHQLIAHADASQLDNVPLSLDELQAYMEPLDIEGVVFHHQDGRMAKIKKKDFGMKRK